MRNRKEGFTLIELLIVIAIIGILAAVLIPNLLDARKRAFDTGAQSCLKELATAQEVNLVDTNLYIDATPAADDLPSACANMETLTVAADAGVLYTMTAKHQNGDGIFIVTPEGGVEKTN